MFSCAELYGIRTENGARICTEADRIICNSYLGNVKFQFTYYWQILKSTEYSMIYSVEATLFNLLAPCILYIGQKYRYSPQYSFYIFSQQIYLIIFFRLSLTIFVYSSTKYRVYSNATLLGSWITFYINGVLNCECPAPVSKG